jgi:DNA-binding XRE family transcriptional regulator
MGPTFSQLLRQYRERQSVSQSQLARDIGANASTISLLESEARRPARDLVLAIGRALSLSEVETDELLAAALHLPAAYERLGAADRDLQAVLALLSDSRLPEERRQAFRRLIRAGVELCGPVFPPASPSSSVP